MSRITQYSFYFLMFWFVSMPAWAQNWNWEYCEQEINLLCPQAQQDQEIYNCLSLLHYAQTCVSNRGYRVCEEVCQDYPTDQQKTACRSSVDFVAIKKLSQTCTDTWQEFMNARE